MSLYVAYATRLALAILLWLPADYGVEMDKKENTLEKEKTPEKEKTTEKVKPESAAPAPKQARWPGQSANAGIKNARSIHDRKPTGRGAARGR